MLTQGSPKVCPKRAKGETTESGFTLIELLIVIVVLGILAAVVVFALGGVSSKSAVASCNSDGKTVQTAIASYQAQTGSLPTATSSLTSAVTVNGLSYGPYLQSWPSNSPHYTFTLSSAGALMLQAPSSVTLANAVPFSSTACASAT
jgi:general secretion pathway protein G